MVYMWLIQPPRMAARGLASEVLTYASTILFTAAGHYTPPGEFLYCVIFIIRYRFSVDYVLVSLHKL
jgi:hypothetical protein